MIRRLIILLLIVGCDNSTTPTPTHGCLDSQATNYDATASIDNNSCTYIDSCGVIDIDLTNDCTQDDCGVWGGDGVDMDSDSICDDVDDCIVQDGVSQECGCNTGFTSGKCDCDGNVEDCAGVCGGSAPLTDCLLGDWQQSSYIEELGWTVELLLSFKEDGTWTAVLTSEEEDDYYLDTDGIYSINNNEITFTNNDCLVNTDSHNGIYSISIDTNELVIILIEDECTHFAEAVIGTYTKI